MYPFKYVVDQVKAEAKDKRFCLSKQICLPEFQAAYPIGCLKVSKIISCEKQK